MSGVAVARPTQGSLDICDFDGLSDIANLGDPGGAAAVVADTGNDRVLIIGFGCSSFQLDDDGSPPDFEGPRGVAVDPDGRIYVADTGNNRIMRFESIAGESSDDPISLLDIFTGNFPMQNPEGLGVDDDGLIYIANTGAQRVNIMDGAGFGQGVIGSPDNGDDEIDGEFLAPVDVAVCTSSAPGDLGGRIFVVDRDRDNIQVFNEDGDYVFSFGDTGTGPGLFQSPSGIDTDPLCNVYVADAGNDRVQMFDGDGGFLEIVGSLSDAAGVAVAPNDNGGVYATSPTSDEVRTFVWIDYDVNGNGNADDDGDALPDLWEEEGIDLEFDGTVDYDLPSLGADRRHKTIFVEVDYMTFHEPDQAMLDAVIDVFAQAPVSNPDGEAGIDLIVVVDDEVEETPARQDIATWSDFDTIKQQFFGTSAERNGPNAPSVLLAKQLAFRYALFGHIRDGGTSSGRAKGGGNFLISLGAAGWGQDPSNGHNVGSFKEQTGTFMHELGHTLSLGHGGRDGTNFKPNYMSVMNYNFQTSWIQNAGIADGRLDYSSQRLPTFANGQLDENDLDETQGLGLGDVEMPDDRTRWESPNGVTNFGLIGDPLDWDGQNGATDTATDSDLNGDGDQEDLVGLDDWSFLNSTPKAFNFRDSTGFAGVGQPFIDEEPELTAEQAREIADFWRAAQAFKFVYSAKFLCVPLVGPEGTALSPGRYQTAINIHNPSTEDIRFMKKAVTARNENEERGLISPLEEDVLADDEAISIDCTSIAARFDEAQPVGDGFVVIKSNEPLDVVAVYTSRDSVDVETVVPTVFEDEEDDMPGDDDPGDVEPRERADLVIDLPARTRVTCPGGQGTCRHFVRVEVRNIGSADAGAPFDVRLTTDDGLKATETLPGLAAGDTALFTLELGPGDNCYNPDCQVNGIVDDGDAIPETDESNNTATRLDQG